MPLGLLAINLIAAAATTPAAATIANSLSIGHTIRQSLTHNNNTQDFEAFLSWGFPDFFILVKAAKTEHQRVC
ncbi:hypothetical protein LWI28_007496 [Acer negundo]|uniref:Secreted protein n=1 Tax=Acer negundo TaxID=4023 RepID=A0AAD5J3J8_ACENE|nr:hypothetical protein LWI28_007496 [Acer negundo]